MDQGTDKIPQYYEFESEQVNVAVSVQDVAGELCKWLCPDQVLELLAQTYERRGEDSLSEPFLTEFVQELRGTRDKAKELQGGCLRSRQGPKA